MAKFNCTHDEGVTSHPATFFAMTNDGIDAHAFCDEWAAQALDDLVGAGYDFTEIRVRRVRGGGE